MLFNRDSNVGKKKKRKEKYEYIERQIKEMFEQIEM